MAAKDASASPEFYRRLFEYNRRVLERYIERNYQMGRKAASKDRGIGIGSYHDTLAHILRVHDAWLNYVVPGDFEGLHASHREFVKEFRTLDLRQFQRKSWKGIDLYLSRVTPRELLRVVRAPWMPGRYTVGDVLVQCSFEQAHHLGELIGASWRENKASPQMMWIPTLTGKKVSVS